MKALSQKLNKVLAISYMALSLLPAGPSLASNQQLEEWDSLHAMVGKPILIKNLDYNEFLYLPDDDTINGDRITKGFDGLSSRSVFTLQKENMGYLIKNIHFGEFLYASENPEVHGRSVIESNKKITKRSYFKICNDKFEDENGKEKKGISITTIDNDYVVLSAFDKSYENRIVKTSKSRDSNGRFSFIDVMTVTVGALLKIDQNN